MTLEELDNLTGWECPHGTRKATLGIGKGGRPWAGLLCPGRDCDPVWLGAGAIMALQEALIRHQVAESRWIARADALARKPFLQTALEAA